MVAEEPTVLARSENGRSSPGLSSSSTELPRAGLPQGRLQWESDRLLATGNEVW